MKKTERIRSLFSFSAYHFLDDGFSDSIYLLLPFIATEFSLSFGQVGLLRGVSSGAMSLFQVPLSLLGERIGELTVVAAGTFGLAGGFLLLSRVHTFAGIFLSLIFAKGTAAGQHGLCSSLLSKDFEASGRRAALGAYNFSGDLGKVCVPFFLTVMINLWGWREALFVLSVFGLAGGAGLYFLAVKKRGNPAPPEPGKDSPPQARGWGIGKRKDFLALLTIGVIDISTRMALLTFLPFLLIEKGVAASQIGFALTLLFAGGAIGRLACGILAEWLGTIALVVATEILTAAGILFLTWASTSAAWVALPLVGFVLSGTSSVLYATVAEILPAAARSRGYGLYYAVTMGSGGISPLVFGLVTDSMGLSFTIMSTALMVLLTLPLTRPLSKARS